MPPDLDKSTSAATATDVYLRVVLGSTTPPGRLHRAVEGAIERAAERGVEADLFDLGAQTIAFADGTPARTWTTTPARRSPRSSRPGR